MLKLSKQRGDEVLKQRNVVVKKQYSVEAVEAKRQRSVVVKKQRSVVVKKQRSVEAVEAKRR